MTQQSPLLLGIDLGTSACKCVLADPTGTPVALTRAEYGPALIEGDTRRWWQAVRECVRRLGDSHSIAAVGLSGQMHGLVLLDAQHQPVRDAITWAHVNEQVVDRRFQQLAESHRYDLLNPPFSGAFPSAVAWLKDHDPTSLDRSRWYVLPKDWLGARLTGTIGTEPTDASATLLWHFPEHRWHHEVADQLGIAREALPPVRRSDDVRGELRPGPARELGLRPGLPVVHGLADVGASLLATGTDRPDSTALLSIGTGAQLVAVTADLPSPVRNGLTVFCGPHVRTYYRMAGLLSGGGVLRWITATLQVTWADFVRALVDSPPGARGVTFLPFLMGERIPLNRPDLSAAWSGLRLHHTRDDMLRAVVEALAFAIGDALDELRVQGAAVTSAVTTGGAAQVPTVRQLLADVLRIPLQPSDLASAPAMGAALAAGSAVDTRLAADPTAGPDAAIVGEMRILPSGDTTILADARARYHDIVAREASR